MLCWFSNISCTTALKQKNEFKKSAGVRAFDCKYEHCRGTSATAPVCFAGNMRLKAWDKLSSLAGVWLYSTRWRRKADPWIWKAEFLATGSRDQSVSWSVYIQLLYRVSRILIEAGDKYCIQSALCIKWRQSSRQIWRKSFHPGHNQTVLALPQFLTGCKMVVVMRCFSFLP